MRSLRSACGLLRVLPVLVLSNLFFPPAEAVVPDGDPFDWTYDHLKALDHPHDGYYWGDGKDKARDLVAFYYSEEGDYLQFRLDLFTLNPGDEYLADWYIVMDFAPGGQKWLPDKVDALTDLGDGWDLAVCVYGPDWYNIYLPNWSTANSLMNKVAFSTWDAMIEVSIKKPWTFPWGGTVKFQVYTTRGWTDGNMGEIYGHPDITDDFVDDDRGWTDGWLNGSFSSNDKPGRAKISFMHHGNQAVGWSDVLRGRIGAEEQSGFDEVLRAHEHYNVPASVHLSGTLMTAAQWHDPAFNKWIGELVKKGLFEMMISTYAQHIMPFVHDDMNDWALGFHKALVWHMYGYDANGAWVPERSVEYLGSDGVIDWLGDNFARQHIDYVILDNIIHGSHLGNTRKVYQMWNGPKVLFRDDWFSGIMHGGDMDQVRNAFLWMALSPDQEQVLIYADDMEMAGQVGNWEKVMPWALTQYWNAIRYVRAHPWIQAVKLDNVFTWGWKEHFFWPNAGTHGSIGGHSGYGGWSSMYGRNSWYNHWASFVPPSVKNGKNYGVLWNDAHWALSHAPHNAARESGWLTMMTNLFETGWHEGLGGPISFWEHNHSGHIKNANVHAEAAHWVSWGTRPTEAFWWDMDNDGFQEIVVRNDKLMAVFERRGARAQWIFDHTGQLVAGNDMAYWPGTDGDDNDANHIAPLSDVWNGSKSLEHELYSVKVNIASGDTVQVTFTKGDVKKVVRLSKGKSYLDVTYAAPGDLWVRSGFSPGLLALVLDGNILETFWKPGEGYVGFRNPHTGTLAGIVLGSGGAEAAKGGDSTLVRWAEIKGHKKMRFFLYAGPGNEDHLKTLVPHVTP